MKGSINRKLHQIPRGHLLVGIDPHKKRHAVAIMTPQAMVISKFKVSNSLDGFTHLCQRVDHEVDRQGASGAMYAIKARTTRASYWATPRCDNLEERLGRRTRGPSGAPWSRSARRPLCCRLYAEFDRGPTSVYCPGWPTNLHTRVPTHRRRRAAVASGSASGASAPARPATSQSH